MSDQEQLPPDIDDDYEYADEGEYDPELSAEDYADYSEAADLVINDEAETETADSLPPIDPVGVIDAPLMETDTNLQSADANADADLARPARAIQYRSQRRAQISMSLPALLMIAVGILLLYEAVAPDAERLSGGLLVGVAAAAFGIGVIARFFLNGRRERGLFVVGQLALAWSGLAALIANGSLRVDQAWPFGIAAVGVALFVTFFFERSHERGLLFPALIFLMIGFVAGLFAPALSALPADIVSLAATFWPLLILVGALLLLPRAIRPRGE